VTICSRRPAFLGAASRCSASETEPTVGSLSTHSEGAATVVAATGAIDASNIDRLTDYTWRAVAEGRGLVLDLSKLCFLGAQRIPVLISLGEECYNADVGCAVVASHPVQRLLRIGDPNNQTGASRGQAGRCCAESLLRLFCIVNSNHLRSHRSNVGASDEMRPALEKVVTNREFSSCAP
jgi:anti-anti-sigma regulatory factor